MATTAANRAWCFGAVRGGLMVGNLGADVHSGGRHGAQARGRGVCSRGSSPPHMFGHIIALDGRDVLIRCDPTSIRLPASRFDLQMERCRPEALLPAKMGVWNVATIDLERLPPP